MIILVEPNVKGFFGNVLKRLSIYGQNHKVANSERYWTLLTIEKTVACNLNVFAPSFTF